jgi:hypothetical protein
MSRRLNACVVSLREAGHGRHVVPREQERLRCRAEDRPFRSPRPARQPVGHSNHHPAARRKRVHVCWSLVAALGALGLLFAPLALGASKSFRVELSGEGQAEPEYLECFTQSGHLECLAYNRPMKQICDFGGTVLTLNLNNKGRFWRTHTCVDEGSHDQPFLRQGRAFRAVGVTCRVGLLGEGIGAYEELRCRPARGRGFGIGANGKIRRLAP